MIYLAVVWSGHGIHYLTAAPTADLLHAGLAGYVLEQLPWSLREEDADRVRTLVADGDPGEAVRWYFDRVGERWGDEALHVERIGPSEGLEYLRVQGSS